MSPAMPVLETDRLVLREYTPDDATVVLALLNEPSFLRYIGDRGVRTLDDARAYLRNGPLASYEKNGFGLYAVERKDEPGVIGQCGLLRRDGLDDPDIGFSFFPAHWGQGYAYEAARAVIVHGQKTLGLRRIVAITSFDNDASIRLLEKLGFRFERTLRIPNDDEELRLFALEA